MPKSFEDVVNEAKENFIPFMASALKISENQLAIEWGLSKSPEIVIEGVQEGMDPRAVMNNICLRLSINPTHAGEALHDAIGENINVTKAKIKIVDDFDSKGKPIITIQGAQSMDNMNQEMKKQSIGKEQNPYKDILDQSTRQKIGNAMKPNKQSIEEGASKGGIKPPKPKNIGGSSWCHLIIRRSILYLRLLEIV